MAENKTFQQRQRAPLPTYQADPNGLTNAINPSLMLILQDILRAKSSQQEFGREKELEGIRSGNRRAEDKAASGNRIAELAEVAKSNERLAKMQSELATPPGKVKSALTAMGYSEEEVKNMPSMKQIDEYTSWMSKAAAAAYTESNNFNLAIEARLAQRATADGLRAASQGAQFYAQNIRMVNSGKLTTSKALEQINKLQNTLATEVNQSVLHAQNLQDLYTKQAASVSAQIRTLKGNPVVSAPTAYTPPAWAGGQPNLSAEGNKTPGIDARFWQDMMRPQTGPSEVMSLQPDAISTAARAELKKAFAGNPQMATVMDAVLSVGSEPELQAEITNIAQKINLSLESGGGMPKLSAREETLWNATNSESGADAHMIFSTMHGAFVAELSRIQSVPTVGKDGQALPETASAFGDPYQRQVLQEAARIAGRISNVTFGAPVPGAVKQSIMNMNEGVIRDAVGGLAIGAQKTAADTLFKTGLLQNFNAGMASYLRIPPNQRNPQDEMEVRKIIGDLKAAGMTGLTDKLDALISLHDSIPDDKLSQDSYALISGALKDVVDGTDFNNPQARATLDAVGQKLSGGLPPEFLRAQVSKRIGAPMTPDQEAMLTEAGSYTQQIQQTKSEGVPSFKADVSGLQDVTKELNTSGKALEGMVPPPGGAPTVPSATSQPTSQPAASVSTMTQDDLEFWTDKWPGTLGFAASYLADPSVYAPTSEKNPMLVLGGRGWDWKADADREVQTAKAYADAMREQRDVSMQEGAAQAQMQQQAAAAQQQQQQTQPQQQVAGRPMQQTATPPQGPMRPTMPTRQIA